MHGAVCAPKKSAETSVSRRMLPGLVAISLVPINGTGSVEFAEQDIETCKAMMKHVMPFVPTTLVNAVMQRVADKAADPSSVLAQKIGEMQQEIEQNGTLSFDSVVNASVDAASDLVRVSEEQKEQVRAFLMNNAFFSTIMSRLGVTTPA